MYNFDISLEDIIKRNKPTKKPKTGVQKTTNKKAGGITRRRLPNTQIQKSVKVMLSNLQSKVTDEDIRDLFGEVGPLKNSSLHYDRTGKAVGTAHVVFQNRVDAIKAVKMYNGMPLDGKPMKIEMVGGGGPRMVNVKNVKKANNEKKAASGGKWKVQEMRSKNKKTTREELDVEMDAFNEAKKQNGAKLVDN